MYYMRAGAIKPLARLNAVTEKTNKERKAEVYFCRGFRELRLRLLLLEVMPMLAAVFAAMACARQRVRG